MVSDVRFDAETKLAEAPVDAKADLRLWLRLFTCTSLIEGEIRRRLRKQFGETLPRFDLMAQLDRVEHGMTLGEVSKRMMVSAGNVTSLVERMVQAGYVERRTAPNDRRSQLIRLTRNGRHAFGLMAAAHQAWIARASRRARRTRHGRRDGRARQAQALGDPRHDSQRWAAMSVAPLAAYAARHVRLTVADAVATITLDRPERKNPLTFESYAELVDIFAAAATDDSVHAFVLTGAGGNFSSGGDVFEIIGPLLERDSKGLLAFTTMTGNLVKAMRGCPQPIVAAIDGVCAGAGAIMAMAADLRLGTAAARIAFLFNRVGLAGCDMGACAILPRIIGQGRAAELLFTGRSLSGEEAERWGFLNRLCDPAAPPRRGDRAGRDPRPRSDLRQRADQAHARDGMGDERAGGDQQYVTRRAVPAAGTVRIA